MGSLLRDSAGVCMKVVFPSCVSDTVCMMEVNTFGEFKMIQFSFFNAWTSRQRPTQSLGVESASYVPDSWNS